MKQPLYVDSSSFMRIALQEHNWVELVGALGEQESLDQPRVSSRLLWLESRRASISRHLRMAEVDGGTVMSNLLEGTGRILVTDTMWQRAHDIPVPLKSLDAIHLGTCQDVGAILLSSDKSISEAALAVGVSLHPASTAA